MSESCLEILDLDSLSSSEAGVNPGKRSWEWHLIEGARCQRAIGGIYFTKKSRAGTPKTCLEFDNFRTRLESGISKCISWLNDSFFRGDDRCFLKDRVMTYLMTPMSPVNSHYFIYSLWVHPLLQGIARTCIEPRVGRSKTLTMRSFHPEFKLVRSISCRDGGWVNILLKKAGCCVDHVVTRWNSKMNRNITGLCILLIDKFNTSGRPKITLLIKQSGDDDLALWCKYRPKMASVFCRYPVSYMYRSAWN